jgi:hypothetical protein
MGVLVAEFHSMLGTLRGNTQTLHRTPLTSYKSRTKKFFPSPW